MGFFPSHTRLGKVERKIELSQRRASAAASARADAERRARPPFTLSTGGCSCASCKETAQYIGKGFAAWPRGNPAGPRRSAADYAAHVAHGKTGLATGWTFKCGAAPKFSNDPPVSDFVGSRTGTPGCNPVTQAPRLVLDFIAAGYKKTGQAEAQPVSPASACKPPQHFPELDRQRGASRIYAMQKDQPKRIRGRPAIDGRRVVIKLAERDIARARELGGGGKQAIAAGVRMALRQSSG